MEQEQDFDDPKQVTAFIHSHSGKLRYFASYSLLTTVPARNLVTISTTSTAASSTSANAATNVTDVSPEPVILQIQDNNDDLEERRRLCRH